MEKVYGAKAVVSNQEGPYENLEKTVVKYNRTKYQRPFADHTRIAFEKAFSFVETFYKQQGHLNEPFPVILDSGCGTGESSIHLAKRNPNIPIIGIDKSMDRLNKAGNTEQLKNISDNIPPNIFWIRAELLDFWRLALEYKQNNKWTIPYHAIFYPNPWPKQNEATRRFHLHPIFPTLLALSEVIELRTNWEIYAQEFSLAAKIILDLNKENSLITCESFIPTNPETAFERKYAKANQTLWRSFIKKI